jgi:hypothetical protein
MTVKAVLIRFAIAYVALVLVTVLMNFYLDIKSGILLSTAVLIGAIYWACLEFSKKNKRDFTKKEKTAAIFGFISVDLSLQFGFSLVAVFVGEATIGLIRQVAFGFLLVGSLHALVVYYILRSSEKIIARQNVLNG